MYKKKIRPQTREFVQQPIPDDQLCQDILDSIKTSPKQGQKRNVFTKDNTKYLYYKPSSFEQSNSTVQTVIKNEANGYMKPYFVQARNVIPQESKAFQRGMRKMPERHRPVPERYYTEEPKPGPYRHLRYIQPGDAHNYEYVQMIEPDGYGESYMQEPSYEELQEYDQTEESSEKYYIDDDEEKYKEEYVKNYIKFVQTNSTSCDTVPEDYQVDKIPVKDKKHTPECINSNLKHPECNLSIETKYMKPNPFMTLKSSTDFATECESAHNDIIKKNYVTVSRFVQTDPVEFEIKKASKTRWTQTDNRKIKKTDRIVQVPVQKSENEVEVSSQMNISREASNKSFTSSMIRYSRILLFVTVICNIVRTSIANRIK